MVLMLLVAVVVVAVAVALAKMTSKRKSIMKTCPHCAESIKPEARICRFCQRPV
jgi:hypothetical protein